MRENPRAHRYAAAFGVISPVIKPADTRKRNGLRAHGARLKRDIEVAALEPLRPKQFCRLPDGDHLRVPSGVMRPHNIIARTGQHLAVWPHNNSAYGHLAALGGCARFIKSGMHMRKMIYHAPVLARNVLAAKAPITRHMIKSATFPSEAQSIIRVAP